MTAASVNIIFKSVVVAKLLYAASSWWGFATADDRKRLQAVISRGIRSGLCEQHHKTLEELVQEADDKLFTNVIVVVTRMGPAPDDYASRKRGGACGRSPS